MSLRLTALRQSLSEAGGAGTSLRSLPPGSPSLQDRYELLAVISEDPVGKTWRARQRAGGREVVLRLMSAGRESEGHEARAARFLQLAALCAGLKHANHARVLDFGSATYGGAAILFLASEPVEGRSLADVLRAQGPMELRRALRVLIEVCRVLEDAHAIGVVHGDLNPANILLQRGDSGESVRVLGFGVGDLFDELHHARDAVAGPTSPSAYRAPESIRRLPLDGRADLYSLGALLYLMVTGQAAFARDNVMATLMAHLVEQVPTLSERVGREFPETVEGIARRALEKSPRDRFPNVLAMREALEIALGTLPLPTRAPAERPPQLAEIDVLEGVRSIGVSAALLDLSGAPEPALRPIEGLRARVDATATGCLTVMVSERASYRVFLMQGEIVALYGPGDGLATLRRLVSVGAVAPARVAALSVELQGGTALDAALNGEVPDAVIEEAMRAQVRQNAVSLAGLRLGALRWRDLDAVLVPDFVGFQEAVAPLLAPFAEATASAPPVSAVLGAAPVAAPQPGPASTPVSVPVSAPYSAPYSGAGAPPARRSPLPWVLAAVAALVALWFGLRGAPTAPPQVDPLPATGASAPDVAASVGADATPPGAGSAAEPGQVAPSSAPPASAKAASPAKEAPRAATPAPASKPASKPASPAAPAPTTPTTPTAPAASPAASPATWSPAAGSDLKDPFAPSH